MTKEIKLELRFPEKVEVSLTLPETFKITEIPEAKKPVFFEAKPFFEEKPFVERKPLSPFESGYSIEKAKEIYETLQPLVMKALDELKKLIEERRKKELEKKEELKSEELSKRKLGEVL
ncbi:MAG: hypothetical protein QW734_05390 [Candidatus Bathyarchaeia archaeon]